MSSTLNHIVLLAALLTSLGVQTAGAETDDYVRRVFLVDVVVCSYVPGEGIEGYDRHGSGMAVAHSSVGLGSVGLGMKISDVSVSVKINPRLEDGRFLVTINFESKNAKRVPGFEKKDLDLTDLKPLAIRLATSEKGRVYQLNLTPSVSVTDNTPRRLDVSKLHFHNWRFPNSPILVNDALYVGRISCSQNSVASVDISGVASVEFSLHQLRNAKLWGVLHNGIVTLTHPDDQTKIQISNVRNGGPHSVDLPGGPYRVWVRWSDPTYTVEQHRQMLVEMRERLVNSDFPKAHIASLDKQLARDPNPWVSSSGIRGLRKGERVDEAD